MQGPPRLSATRFLAFGDSLTAGVLSPAVTLLIVSPPDSYPFGLQSRLVSRYRQQTPVVLNEGNPGELASGTGVQRFRSVLLQNRPEVVLLMEGTNDLLDRPERRQRRDQRPARDGARSQEPERPHRARDDPAAARRAVCATATPWSH